MAGAALADCAECGSRFRFQEEFREHTRRHHGGGAGPEMFSVDFTNYTATISTVFRRLFGSSERADVTVVAEGQAVRAHGLVLATFSPFFKEVLEGLEAWQHPVIVVKGVAFTELQALLEFMYLGSVSVARERLQPLVEAGRLLRVQGIDSELVLEGVGVRGEDTLPTSPSPLTKHFLASPTPSKPPKRKRVSGGGGGRGVEVEVGRSGGVAAFRHLREGSPLVVDPSIIEDYGDIEEEEQQLKIEGNGATEQEEVEGWGEGEEVEERREAGVEGRRDFSFSTTPRESKQPKKYCSSCDKSISSTNFSRHLKQKHPELV